MSFIRSLAGAAGLALAALLTSCGGGSGDTAPREASALKATLPAEPNPGIWWNASEPGRGFAVERQGTRLALGAYMYEASGAPVWYTGMLLQQADGSYTGRLSRHSGGQTLTGLYRPTQASVPVATATFVASDPDTATLHLATAATTRVVPIQRITSTSAAAPALRFEPGLWWDESESGRGFFIHATGTTGLIGSYMYDESGQPVWYLAVGELANGASLTATMERFSGGQTLEGEHRPATRAGTAGTLRFVATSATTGLLYLPDLRILRLSRTHLSPQAPAPYWSPRPQVAAIGTKVFGANELRYPALALGCTSFSEACWKESAVNGTVKYVASGATMPGLNDRPLVFAYYRRAQPNGAMGWHVLALYADDGHIVANDIAAGAQAEIDWIVGSARGVIIHKADGLCQESAWDGASRAWKDVSEWPTVACP